MKMLPKFNPRLFQDDKRLKSGKKKDKEKKRRSYEKLHRIYGTYRCIHQGVALKLYLWYKW